MVTVPKINHPSVAPIPKIIAQVFMPLMYVAIALLVGAIVLLVLATRKQSQQKRASDAALDHLERVKRRDYVTPGEDDIPQARPQPEKQAPAKPAPVQKQAQKAAEPEPQNDVELPHMKYVRNAYQRNAADHPAGYDKASIYDDDPLVSGGYGDTKPDEDLYHTYGSDSDLPPLRATHAAKAAPKPKGWSAYQRRSEPEAPVDQAYDAQAAYRPARGQAAADEPAYRQGAAYGTDDPYAAYDDQAYAPAQDDDYAAYAEGADDGYADDGAAYPQDDGYTSDPLGYGEQSGYDETQNGYAEPAYDDGAAAPDAGDYGTQAPRRNEGGGAGTGRAHRRSDPNRGEYK
jgi:hypothetical protein